MSSFRKMQSTEVVGADLYHTTIGKVVLGNHGWDLKDVSTSLICRELELQNYQKNSTVMECISG